MYDASDVAAKINQLLKEKQLSQKDMLESCNLSKNAISSMLSRGSMLRADNLARIADYLDCSIDYLMGRTCVLKEARGFSTDLEYKYNSLRQEDKEEVAHMINYKYEKCQNKRKEMSSVSDPTPTSSTNNMLA